jgi:hypothetical protein
VLTTAPGSKDFPILISLHFIRGDLYRTGIADFLFEAEVLDYTCCVWWDLDSCSDLGGSDSVDSPRRICAATHLSDLDSFLQYDDVAASP